VTLIDTHTHLHEAEFTGDVDAVIDRARAAGVEAILTLGTDVASSERAVALAERFDVVWAAVGVHPHDAHSFNDATLGRLRELARHPKVVAVGEIGLDFYRNLSPRDDQLRAFEAQLKWAAEIALPVAIHSRDAHADVERIAGQWSRRLRGALPGERPLGVMHYFSGDVALARRYISLGFVISIHTSVTHPGSERLREVARALPLDRLVVETDAPYGAPQSHRGERNEPAYVVEAAVRVAEVRGVPVQEVERATTAAAARLLGLGERVGRGTS
jgi:TatD DNase family protein